MRKGQEEAPIELLIGVTILTFVVIIGFYTYQNMCSSTYDQKLRSSLSSFARAIEGVYQGGISDTQQVRIDFGEIGCASKIESIRMMQGSIDTCQSQLAKDDCLQLLALRREGTRVAPVAVEVLSIPSSVTVRLIGGPSGCPAADQVTGDINLNDIDFNRWKDDDYARCGWIPQQYSFKIKKVSSSEIEITQLG